MHPHHILKLHLCYNSVGVRLRIYRHTDSNTDTRVYDTVIPEYVIITTPILRTLYRRNRLRRPSRKARSQGSVDEYIYNVLGEQLGVM